MIVNMLGGKECLAELLKDRDFKVPQALATENRSNGKMGNLAKYFIAR